MVDGLQTYKSEKAIIICLIQYFENPELSFHMKTFTHDKLVDTYQKVTKAVH